MNFPPHIIALTHVVGSLDLGKEEGRVGGWGGGGRGLWNGWTHFGVKDFRIYFRPWVSGVFYFFYIES